LAVTGELVDGLREDLLEAAGSAVETKHTGENDIDDIESVKRGVGFRCSIAVENACRGISVVGKGGEAD